MKFHHLARHNQFVGAHQQRDVSPTKQQLLLQQQQVAASMQNQQQLANNGLSDDEDGEFNESYYDSIDQHQLHMQSQQVAAVAAAASVAAATNANGNNQSNGNASAANQQQLDTSGFLMDKNKKLFPQKLWELIHNPSIQHCLRWSQDGQRVYLNRNEFEAYYLKTPNNQFHTQKAISFVRQMNMYGFRKVDDCYYENDNFRRDRQHLLRNMIRRHPNKGLFVGLDHHQLAAATAAQQALHVNQQLQQLEHQHKQRAEQALRLNNYLNNHHHQFHNHHHSAAFAAHHQQQQNHHHHHHQLHHSLPLEHSLSSQLAQAAANHLSQQQHSQQQLHHQHHHQQQSQQNQDSLNSTATALAVVQQSTNNNLANNNNTSNLSNHHQQLPIHHQPKKSRLLSNFYASAASNNNNNNSVRKNDNQLGHNQDSMHSTSSVDTEPSQCSSVNISGSSGSPQPNSPTALHQRFAAIAANHHREQSPSSIKAAVLAAAAAAVASGQDNVKYGYNNGSGNSNSNRNSLHSLHSQQHVATDLSSQSLTSRQALHETLVRSFLQLKQHQEQGNSPQDLLISLQQQQHQQQQQQQQQHHQSSRSLLESLASLSSAGTGSIVDPTSNSPTERTATPPSSPNSPSVGDCISGGSGFEDGSKSFGSLHNRRRHYLDEGNNMALDLAKSSTANPCDVKCQLHDGGDDETELEEDDDDELALEDKDNQEQQLVDTAESPLDETKKVRRFLDDQMRTQRQQQECELAAKENGKTHGDDEELDLTNGMDEAPRKSISVKREPISPRVEDLDGWQHPKKRPKFSNNNNGSSVDGSLSGDDLGAISKSLIIGICDRRGSQLDLPALQEAARYTECFLEILLEDAASIARNSEPASDKRALTDDDDEKASAVCEDDVVDGTKESEKIGEVALLEMDTPPTSANGTADTKISRTSLVDASSLSQALRLIPSKLIAAIQQQVNLNLPPLYQEQQQ